VFFAVVAAIVTVPIAMPALIIGMNQALTGMCVEARLLMPLAIMSLLAAVQVRGSWKPPRHRAQGPATRAAPVIGNLAADRERSLSDYTLHVTLIATFVALCFAMVSFGSWGLYALPALYAAMQVFYDARPDLARRLFAARPLHHTEHRGHR
jgi:hypothetical protein